MVIHHILPFSCPLLQEETLMTVLKQGNKFFDPHLGVGLFTFPFLESDPGQACDCLNRYGKNDAVSPKAKYKAFAQFSWNICS